MELKMTNEIRTQIIAWQDKINPQYFEGPTIEAYYELVKIGECSYYEERYRYKSVKRN